MSLVSPTAVQISVIKRPYSLMLLILPTTTSPLSKSLYSMALLSSRDTSMNNSSGGIMAQGSEKTKAENWLKHITSKDVFVTQKSWINWKYKISWLNLNHIFFFTFFSCLTELMCWFFFFYLCEKLSVIQSYSMCECDLRFFVVVVFNRSHTDSIKAFYGLKWWCIGLWTQTKTKNLQEISFPECIPELKRWYVLPGLCLRQTRCSCVLLSYTEKQKDLHKKGETKQSLTGWKLRITQLLTYHMLAMMQCFVAS